MRHAFVTAGSKGLGKKVCEHLLQDGFRVSVNYRTDAEAVEQLKREWAPYRDRLLFVQGDITKKAHIVRMVDEAVQAFGTIDTLINNAGPYIFERKKLVDYTDDEWYNMVEGNLSAVFHLVKLMIPDMRERKFGRIITYGFQGANSAPGWMNRSGFSAAKVGLVSLTKTLAYEEAENGITVNMINPGNIVGDMKEAAISDARKTIDHETPIGRSGTGEDIARIVSFLCQENSDMITGAVIDVTGGVEVVHRYRT
ncbi:SDR family oxidoreductase [Pueribacillus sp. YX66]|uniref:SDR family oxidoreductase n=1 Tax=Pueribacillus sp. YX66 TaxID=3229242 RepID=UPI00358D27DA